MATDVRGLLPFVTALHDRIRTSVVAACERQSAESMAEIAHDDVGDTIYAVDKVSEETLIEGLATLARSEPLVLVAEGLPNEGLVLPEGTPERDCRWRIPTWPCPGHDSPCPTPQRHSGELLRRPTWALHRQAS